jgi:hypothetical protein
MKRDTTRSSLICLVAIVLVLPGLAAQGAETSKTFNVGDGGLLEVDTDVGSIEVSASGSGTVTVKVLRSGSRADELELDFSQSGDNVSVRGEMPRRGLFGGSSPRVRFVITVPRTYNVDLKTSGGSISVGSLTGQARVKTSGGSLDLGKIDGQIWGRTSGGSIVVDGCTEDVDVDTSGGSIEIGEVDGRVKARTSGGSIVVKQGLDVDAETSGGSIRVEEVKGSVRAETSGGSIRAYISKQPSGDCRLTTSGGGVNVYLATDIALDISAHASGRVYCDLELSTVEKSKRSLTGKLNGGGPELYLSTSGGNVEIHSY